MKKWFTAMGLLWVLYVVAVHGVRPAWKGRFDFTSPDSRLYLALRDRLEYPVEALSEIRTIGYPLFLRLGRAVHPRIPVFFWQIGAFVLSLLFLYRQMRAVGLERWSASALCLSLPLGDARVWQFTRNILSDSLAVTLTLFTFGAWLRYCARSTGWNALILSAIAFFTYQVRPDRLFLVLLVPILFALWRVGEGKWEGLKRSVRPLLRLGGALILPLLAFCCLRWWVVDDFGLVAFGNLNLSAVTSQLLTREMIPTMPPDLQGVSEAIVEGRRKVRMGRHWESIQPKRYEEVETASGRLNYEAMYRQHNAMVWRVVVPALVSRFPPDPISLSRVLGRFNRRILIQKPWLFGSWVANNLWTSLKYSGLQYGLAFLVSVLVWAVAWTLFRMVGVSLAVSPDQGETKQLLPICLGAGLYFIAHSLVVSAAGIADVRYLAAAGVFLPWIPCSLVLLAMPLLREALGSFRRRGRSASSVCVNLPERA